MLKSRQRRVKIEFNLFGFFQNLTFIIPFIFKIFLSLENLNAAERTIKNTCEKIEEIIEEKNKIEVDLKVEELKQKACSDETIKFTQNLIHELEYETDIFRQKIRKMSEEINVTIRFIKGKKKLKKYLNNFK